MISVADMVGLPSLPSTKQGALKWLRRSGIPLARRGRNLTFALADLPDDARLAYAARAAEEAGLEPGTYDDAVHAAFLAAPPSMRAEAERKAAIARFLLSAAGQVSRAERVRLVQERWGADAPSKPTLKRPLEAVRGVDPINFAPALLADYRCIGAPRARSSRR